MFAAGSADGIEDDLEALVKAPFRQGSALEHMTQPAAIGDDLDAPRLLESGAVSPNGVRREPGLNRQLAQPEPGPSSDGSQEVGDLVHEEPTAWPPFNALRTRVGLRWP